MAETAKGHCFTNSYSFELGALPFSEMPGQSRLFVDYMRDPLSLKRYFPEVVASHTAVSSRIPSVLGGYEVDRDALCDALESINNEAGCGEETLANIDLLRQDDCVAVVTGQQAGLFSGPLFTVYKALSAIKLAKCLRDRGFKAVPVFWIATEDHDFAEVSRTAVVDTSGALSQISVEPEGCRRGLPVGRVSLDSSITGAVDRLFASLPHTEFTSELRALIESSWKEGAPFGDAFAGFMTAIFKERGLILLCPLNRDLKTLAAPIYKRAVERSESLVEALRSRSAELEADGYHAQVHVGEDYFPLFWQDAENVRHGLKRGADGILCTKDGSVAFSKDQLSGLAESEPWRFSPSVVLRSVVQDYLLPTVAYFGGAAEIAYFAQSAEVYRVLDRPVTPIIHRESFTVVEPRHRKSMERYGLELKDLFMGLENLLPRIVEAHLNKEAGAVFAGSESAIIAELDRLGEALASVDRTLVENLVMRRRKILYHIETLRKKFHNVQIKKDEDARRRIESMFTSLLPEAHLQERSLNITFFLNRYGPGFIDWIYEAIDLDDKDHRLIYL